MTSPIDDYDEVIDPEDIETPEWEPGRQCSYADHFTAMDEACGNVNMALEQLIKVPIRRVPFQPVTSNLQEELPYEVLAASWKHYNGQGPLTEAKFVNDLDGAIQALADAINEKGEFLAYPISNEPGTTLAKAYLDWRGEEYPFDVRFICTMGQLVVDGFTDSAGQPIVENGLNFHLSTLLGKP